MPQAEIAQAVQLLDLMLEHLPTAATGRAAVMMTETAEELRGGASMIPGQAVACACSVAVGVA